MTLSNATRLPRARKGQSLHVLRALLVVVACVCTAPVQAEVDESAPAAVDASESATSQLPAGRKSPATVAILRVVQNEVELSLSAPVQSSRDYLRGDAEKAARCYVDLFPASFSSRGRSAFDLPTGAIRKVRISQFRAGVVRVVLDLRDAHQCTVTTLTNPQRLLVSMSELQELAKSPSPSLSKGKDIGARPAPPRNEELRGQEKSRKLSVVETAQQQEQEKSEDPLPGAWRAETQPWTMLKPTPSARLSEEPHLVAPGLPLMSEAPIQEEAPNEVKVAEPPHTQVTEPPTVKVPEFQEPMLFSHDLTREPNHTGGTIMQQFWMILMGASVVAAFLSGGGVMFLWNARKRKAQPREVQPEKSDGWEARMAYLEEAVNRAGMLNSSFFHSLEITQKRLEALLTQTDLAEQNLRRLLHQSALSGEQLTGRSTDSYSTAAMLLAEGEDVQQVARVLKLPLAQVRLLQELRRSTQGEQQEPRRSPQGEKSAAPQEKIAEAQHGRSLAAGLKSFVTQLNGAPDDGTPFAQNGQTL